MQIAPNEQVIREKLAACLDGKITLRAFFNWFIPATWTVGDSSPISQRDLVNEIKLRHAEYSSGHWSRDEFKDKLSDILGSVDASLGLDIAEIVDRVPEHPDQITMSPFSERVLILPHLSSGSYGRLSMASV